MDRQNAIKLLEMGAELHSHTQLSIACRVAIHHLKQNGWRPISTAPENSELGYLAGHWNHLVAGDQVWRWTRVSRRDTAEILGYTHWVPVPNPPAKENV